MDFHIEQVKVNDTSLRKIQNLLQLVFEAHADKFSFGFLKLKLQIIILCTIFIL
jgi:hypothetical protein